MSLSKFAPDTLLHFVTSASSQCGRDTFRPLTSRAQLSPSNPMKYVGIRALLAHVDNLSTVALLKDVAREKFVMVDHRT